MWLELGRNGPLRLAQAVGWYIGTMTPSRSSRQHTFQAYRVLARPSDSSHYQAQVDDLVQDIHDGSVQVGEMDVDGTSMVALALRNWSDARDWDMRRAHHANQATPPGAAPPAIPAWQRPALALIEKGANPFVPWPRPGSPPWDGNAAGNHARCGVLAAIQEQAWDVLERCLKHPECPPAKAFDAVRASHFRPLLQVVLGSARGLDLLLEHGLDPNEADPHGRTPIFHAEDPEVVEKLLAAGADPGARDLNHDDAPTYWGRRMKAPKPLLEAWRARVPVDEAPGTGRMVVAALRSNSVEAMNAALKASGWTPDMPVDVALHPTRRLLPAAAMALLQNARGAGRAVPVAPLRELLRGARFANLWTAEEKAWAACALTVVQGMAKGGTHAFTSASLATVDKLLGQLMEDPEVAIKVGSSFVPMLHALDAKQPLGGAERFWWKAWLLQIPLQTDEKDPCVNGVASLLDLWNGPWERARHSLENASALNTELFMRLAEAGFSNMDADLLLACLRLRAGEGCHRYSIELVEPDRAWQRAWSALPAPQAFTMGSSFFESMVECMLEGGPESVSQGLAWKQWALDTRLPHAAPGGRLPRL